jgi:hypothetical protein
MGFVEPDKLYFRIFVLINICLLTFGSYFIYDIPGSIPDALQSVRNFVVVMRKELKING